MKILVVDDELVSRMKMMKILEGLGDCEEAENGTAAIASFRKALADGTPFALATLDISMPDMDGTFVLEQLRELEDAGNIPKHKRVKVIMVTAHSDKDNIITSIQAGCDDYVVKPFTKEVVFKKLEKLGFHL